MGRRATFGRLASDLRNCRRTEASWSRRDRRAASSSIGRQVLSPRLLVLAGARLPFKPSVVYSVRAAA